MKMFDAARNAFAACMKAVDELTGLDLHPSLLELEPT